MTNVERADVLARFRHDADEHGQQHPGGRRRPSAPRCAGPPAPAYPTSTRRRCCSTTAGVVGARRRLRVLQPARAPVGRGADGGQARRRRRPSDHDRRRPDAGPGRPSTRIVLAASADGGTFGQVPDLRAGAHRPRHRAALAVFPMQAATETAFVQRRALPAQRRWKFRAVGQGYASGLAGLAADFGIDAGESARPQAPAARPPRTVQPRRPPHQHPRPACTRRPPPASAARRPPARSTSPCRRDRPHSRLRHRRLRQPTSRHSTRRARPPRR